MTVVESVAAAAATTTARPQNWLSHSMRSKTHQTDELDGTAYTEPTYTLSRIQQVAHQVRMCLDIVWTFT